MLGFHVEVVSRDRTQEPSDHLPEPKRYKGLGLSLGETCFEQVKYVVLVKDGRGNYGTSVWVPTVGADGVRGEMALPAEHPQVVGG